MATFNGARYLQEQIESILCQTIVPREIVISDDGSEDNTLSIIESYSRRYPSIKLIANPHKRGFIKNFENALVHCSGEYIALADQDDIWEPSKLEVLVNKIGSNSLIHSDAKVIDAKGVLLHQSWTAFYKKKINQEFIDYLCKKNIVTGCTSLFKKELVPLIVPFPDEVLFHDWWLSLVAFRSGGIAYLDMPLVRYRIHADNTIGAGTTHFTSYQDAVFNVSYYSLLLSRKDLLKITEGEADIIREMLNYYSNRMNKKICFQNMRIAAKHHWHIFGQPTLRVRNLLSAAFCFRGKQGKTDV